MSTARPARVGPVSPEWSGLLPVDKPTGMTSHDVVARARRRLRMRAVGHLGTLDPGASGLLVLVLGAATRCALVWQGGRKTYAGTARFGITTDSQDLDGSVLTRSDARPTESELRATANTMLGELSQVPPMVSALKVHGERLHALARRGVTVEREPRLVRVDAWRWGAITADEATFEVDCSGGTYVRTLVHDLGQQLGCGATLAALRRTRSEPFSLLQACPLAALDAAEPAALLAQHGVALDAALEVLPALVVDAAQAAAIGQGQGPRVAAGPAPLAAGPRSVVFRDADGRALALGELRAEGDGVRARPAVVFPWAVTTGQGAIGERRPPDDAPSAKREGI
jgi:tRNA pseudouridine55 synthase